MRARMLVDSRNVSAETDYKVGQELEGAEAEYQVALGHAEELPEPEGKGKAKAEAEPKKESKEK